MKGIYTEEFEIALKKNNAILNELNEDINKLKSSFQNLSLKFSKADLNFIYSNSVEELNQFVNITNKLNSYQTVLKNIYNAYQEQAIQITNDINNLTT